MQANACSRIKHNAESSPFFRLPAELRRKILIEVLGHRLIHVKYLLDDDYELVSDPKVYDHIDRWAILVCDTEAARPLPQNANMSDDEDIDDGNIIYDEESDDEEGDGVNHGSEEDDGSTVESVSEYEVSEAEAPSIDSERSGELGENIQGSAARGMDLAGKSPGALRPALSSSSAPSDSSPDYDDDFWLYEIDLRRHDQFLIGHLCKNLASHTWKNNKERLEFGDATTRSGCGIANSAISEREMHLPLLRVCRQMYTEASQVLWESNIFSFNDVASLKQFMNTKSGHHKRSIRSLRLAMDWTLTKAADSWNRALSMPLVKALQGLRVLWLHINTGMFRCDFEDSGMPNLWTSSSLGYTKGIEKLAKLPITKAEVYIFNKTLDPSDSNLLAYNVQLWTKHRKRLFAIALQTRLLSASGGHT